MQHNRIKTAGPSFLSGYSPRVTEDPVVRHRVGRGRERDAEDDEEDVGDGQVQDQQVGGVPHLLVEAHDQDHLQRNITTIAGSDSVAKDGF